jgi:hypothetical protein
VIIIKVSSAPLSTGAAPGPNELEPETGSGTVSQVPPRAGLSLVDLT